MNLRLPMLAVLCFAAWAGTGLASAADELAEVTRLQQAGQTTAALQRADQALASSPRDPQMRFLKAVVLGDVGRSAEAVTILEKLTEDYPDLAEPYNNLAALDAAAGDYPKARAALEQALRLNPGYATAQENLGDVYTALAAQSYAAALRLDPDRAGVAAKLAAVRQLAATRSASSPGAAVSGAAH